MGPTAGDQSPQKNKNRHNSLSTNFPLWFPEDLCALISVASELDRSYNFVYAELSNRTTNNDSLPHLQVHLNYVLLAELS